ncbi:MAG: FGGY family carbohydrate kinase [Eubacteriales bacterium]|nr:FGGY family carbohydrate kinase [Eubacteriales bacterium]MDD4327786.1 FGGY family carbohydrate kinase [Eubacteriales bacterium]MDD4717466.1 FGGY family carbohydrate kinase [Eubacteriales bacterium]
MKYLLGIDIGTQGIKAAAYDEEGRLIASCFEPSYLITLDDGRIVQDADEMLMSAASVIRKTAEKADAAGGTAAALCFDGQMAGILGIGEDHKAVTYYDSWLDTSCSPYVDEMKRTAENELIRTTGSPVTIHHGPKILWWKNERPDVYSRICKFVVPSAYIAGRMAGIGAADAFIDYTQLHFSGFGDVRKLEWSDTLLDRFGVRKDKMPRIVEPWHIAGYMNSEFSGYTGIPEGTIITAGCGDQAASSLGAGITKTGQVFDVSGTASVFSCCVDSFAPDISNKMLLFPRSVLKDLWIPLAYISGGGLCLRWFRDNLTGTESDVPYTVLDSEADAVAPGSGKLLFLPHFAGRTCPADPAVRGSWVGLGMNHTRGHMYRSIMEGIAYEYSMYMDILRTGGVLGDPTEVTAVGGGAVSNVFNKIKADVIGVRYVPLETNETATLGSAVIAGYAAGIFSDIAQTASSFVKKSSPVEPDMENYSEYDPFRKAYRQLLDVAGVPMGLLY